jgi:hypothetical protein
MTMLGCYRRSPRYDRGRALSTIAVAILLPGLMFVASPTLAHAGQPTTEDISALIRQLDDTDYEVRQRSEDRLKELGRIKACRPLLAERFQQVLLQPGTSYEVRNRLLNLRRSLPSPSGSVPAAVDAAELEKLLDELCAASSATRAGAQERLDWMLADQAVAARIMTATKNRLADLDVAAEDRKCLLKLWRDVRGRWLLSPAEWDLPKVEEQQWRHWIDELCRLEDEPSDRRRRATARRELRDLLAREEYVGPVKEALAKRLDYTGDSPATKRIQGLLAWLRPAMVAEVWAEHQHVTIQHLYVDVPQMPEFAVRPTHFDRIDDHTAHCVSGSNLTPGDYPVGVAIPHPRGQTLLFHLINLPTPRRRMAYHFQALRPQVDRLRELSERTLAAVVADRRPLTAAEFAMLRQLDPRPISAFAGPYLEVTKDQPLENTEPNSAAPTQHGAFCLLLAELGTHEAIPALERVATAGEAQAAEERKIYAQAAWIAALAIAQRDAWEGVDEWLASLLDRDTPLMASGDPQAELAATAAALLLKRHDASGPAFGLIDVPDEFSHAAGVTLERFAAPENRAAVREWWIKEKARAAESKAG